jgi:capsular polysaccharide biosynthesis protein
MITSSSQTFVAETVGRQSARGAISPRRRRSGASRWVPTGAALLIGLITFGIGGASVVGAAKTYQASATLLVLPNPKSATESIASLYEALSQGQIVGSFQAVMSSSGFERSAAGDTTVIVTVVPSTSLIDVKAKASSAVAAENAADAVANRAVDTLSTTFKPYTISLVSSAAHTGKTAGTGKGALLGIVALLSVIVGVAVYQAIRFLRGMRAAPRPRGDLASLK